ncbi:MAG: glycoside hydrolase family 2 protein [Abditibacteriota bacterium]|nr:glycoside hydrolase family 2 protein [Abditibacteriota bacterium]
MNNVLSLDGEWTLRSVSPTPKGDICVPASVPGCVHTDLMAAGIIGDPFYRDNEYRDKWVYMADYSYSRHFALDKLPEGKALLLECDGLDTLCEIFINDRPVAATKNMFRRYAFDVTDVLKEGDNEIRIAFASPGKYFAERAGKNNGHTAGDSIPGSEQLRKCHCQSGWDWGPQIPTMGIWRSIRIGAYAFARIRDVKVFQTLSADCRNALLDLEILADEYSPKGRYAVTLFAPDGTAIDFRALAAGESRVSFAVEQPLLWQPAGLGEQPMYSVTVQALAGGEPESEKTVGIGIRRLEVVQDRDRWGRTFYFRVNGAPVFAKGADYLPCDQFPSRLKKEDYEKILFAAKEANMNSLRIWGGGLYEADVFYDLCDRLGLLIWHDFMFACSHYPMTEELKEEYREEAEDNIRRLQHHPSIALWCGNNELEWQLAGGWPGPDCLEQSKEEFKALYYGLLADIAAAEDPSRTYVPASPFSERIFEDPNGEGSGDSHYWEVWHGRKPFTEYRKHFPRFMSEFGFQSVPSLETLKPVTEPEDRVIFSRIMNCHQKNKTGDEAIVYYISKNYKLPKDFENYIYISQLLHGEAMRYGTEHWRRNRNDYRCMGALYWQLNDCWQVSSWASLEYGGRWKACHYMAEEFFAPVLLSLEETDTGVNISLTNDTAEDVSRTVVYSARTTDGRILFEKEAEAFAPAFASRPVFSEDMTGLLEGDGKYRTFFTACIKGETDKTVFFVPAKYMELGTPAFTVKAEAGALAVECDAPAFFVDLQVPDSGVRFRKNFIAMLPGKTYRFEAAESGGLSYPEMAERIKIFDLAHSFRS